MFDVLKTILAIASPFLLAFLAYFYSRKQELEKQLASQKREVYREYLGSTMDTLRRIREHAGQGLSAKEQQRINAIMTNFAANLMLFGSKPVIDRFNDFKLGAESWKSDQNAMIEAFGALILAMRSDLGLSNKDLDSIDLFQTFVKDDLREFLTKGSLGDNSDQG